MRGTRARPGRVFGWPLAVACLVGLMAFGLLLLRSLPPPAAPIAAMRSVLPDPVPAGLPAAAVSVPLLALPDGREVRLGDRHVAVTMLLGRAAETGQQQIGLGKTGSQLIRFYEYGGLRFVIVFEPVSPGGEPRVSGIYLF